MEVSGAAFAGAGVVQGGRRNDAGRPGVLFRKSRVSDSQVHCAPLKAWVPSDIVDKELVQFPNQSFSDFSQACCNVFFEIAQELVSLPPFLRLVGFTR